MHVRAQQSVWSDSVNTIKRALSPKAQTLQAVKPPPAAMAHLLRWRMDVAVTLLMILMQTNGTYRRLLDDLPCQGLPLAFAPPAYPCSGTAAGRLLFLLRKFPSTYVSWGKAVAPSSSHMEGAAPGEMWSFVMLTLLLLQLPLLLLVPDWYRRVGRTYMVPCVHLSDKLVLLACQVVYPHALSGYWDQYFWSEGIIQFWKALLYAQNYRQAATLLSLNSILCVICLTTVPHLHRAAGGTVQLQPVKTVLLLVISLVVSHFYYRSHTDPTATEEPAMGSGSRSGVRAAGSGSSGGSGTGGGGNSKAQAFLAEELERANYKAPSLALAGAPAEVSVAAIPAEEVQVVAVCGGLSDRVGKKTEPSKVKHVSWSSAPDSCIPPAVVVSEGGAAATDGLAVISMPYVTPVSPPLPNLHQAAPPRARGPPPDFLAALNASLASPAQGRGACMVVGLSVRRGCAEIFAEVVMLAARTSPKLARHSPSMADASRSARRSPSPPPAAAAAAAAAAASAAAAAAAAAAGAAGAAEAAAAGAVAPGRLSQRQTGAGAAAGGGEWGGHGDGGYEGSVCVGQEPWTLDVPDPGTWLHHLHLGAPVGTEVLTQVCGGIFASVCCDARGEVWTTRQVHTLCPADLPRILSVDHFILCSTLTASPAPTHASVQALAQDWTHQSMVLSGMIHRDATHSGMRDMGREGVTHWDMARSTEVEALPADCAAPAQLHMQVVVSSAHMASTMSVRCRGRNLLTVATAGGAGAGEAVGDCQSLQVDVLGTLSLNGLIVVEAKLGEMLSNGLPLVVSSDAKLVQEVSRLMGHREGGGPPGSEDFLLDLGSWLEYMDALTGKGLFTPAGPPGPTRASPAPKPNYEPATVVFDQQLTALYHTAPFRDYMSGVALSLLEHALSSACPHLAESVMRGMLRTGDSFPDLLARSQHGSQGVSLLDRANTSGDLEVVALVLGWGREMSCPWEEAETDRSTPSEHGLPASCGSRGGGAGKWTSGTGRGHAAAAAATDDGGELVRQIQSQYEEACSRYHVPTEGHGSAEVWRGLDQGTEKVEMRPRVRAAAQGSDGSSSSDCVNERQMPRHGEQTAEVGGSGFMGARVPRWMQLLQPEGQAGADPGSWDGPSVGGAGPAPSTASCLSRMAGLKGAVPRDRSSPRAPGFLGLPAWVSGFAASEESASPARQPHGSAIHLPEQGAARAWTEASYAARASSPGAEFEEALKLWQGRPLSGHKHDTKRQRLSGLASTPLYAAAGAGDGGEPQQGRCGGRARAPSVTLVVASVGIVLVILCHVLCEVPEPA
ncbi:MAG: hypothetical protein WDW36_005293 [Sanguina aurantia]